MSLKKIDKGTGATIRIIHGGEKGIKPLIEDAFLIRTYVAGWFYNLDADSLKEEFSPGQYLKLYREPSNKYDKRAILIKDGSRKIGYVPRKHNLILANLMDAGKLLYAKVEEVAEEDYKRQNIIISIYLKE